jgi:hypothetical protein
MHPTADTNDFIFGNVAGRRVIGGVRLLMRLGKYVDSPHGLG